MLAKVVRIAEWVLWLGVVALLPITSLPVLHNIFGSAMVAPPSAILLLGLVLIFLLPAVAHGGYLPAQAKPLLAFCVLALISSLASFGLTFPLFHESNITRQILEGCLTMNHFKGMYGRT